MTALNVFVTPEAAFISTDGAGYLMDGRPSFGGQKTVVLAHLPAVLAVRGAAALLPMLAAAVGASVSTFDDLLPVAPELFRGVRQRYRREVKARGLGAHAPQESEFVVAGYSAERGRVEAYAMQSRAWGGAPAWTLCLVTEALITPSDDATLEAVAEVIDRVGDPRAMPEAAAVQIMEAQRARTFETEHGRLVAGVGGFCQLTTLTRDGISTRILRRWPEAVAA